MEKYRWLFVILGAALLGITLIFGAAFGAGITYFFLQADSVQAALPDSVQAGNDTGVLISSVEPGGAADEAGLVRGDIILEVDGEAVNHMMDLTAVLADLEPEEIVQLKVLHGDETRILEAALGNSKGFATLGVGTCDSPKGGLFIPDGQMGEGFKEMLQVGAEVLEVMPGSPAEEAGLQVGDVILSVEQKPISLEYDLADLIQKYQPGDTILLKVRSEGGEDFREIEVTLAEFPDQPGKAYLGVSYQLSGPMSGAGGGLLPYMEGIPFDELPEGEGFQFELPEGWDQDEEFHFRDVPFGGEEGMPHFFEIPALPEDFEGAVIVSEVLEDSPADDVGLQPGDLITAVDGTPVVEIEAFVEELQSNQPGEQVDLTILREGEEIEVSVTLTEHPDDPEKGFLGVMAGTFIIQEELHFPEGYEEDFELELPGVPGGEA